MRSAAFLLKGINGAVKGFIPAHQGSFGDVVFRTDVVDRITSGTISGNCMKFCFDIVKSL